MSFSDAIQGVIHVVRWERNMRIHLAAALLVIVFATVLGVTRLEMTALVLTIGLVFVAELFNTAVEELVDLVTPDYYPLAGLIKNISAGAVLISALTAAGVGYLVFIDYLLRLDQLVFRGQVPFHYLIILAVATVIMVIIAWKASLGQGELLRGGMPSGHTAVAFRGGGHHLADQPGLAGCGRLSAGRLSGPESSGWEDPQLVGSGGRCLGRNLDYSHLFALNRVDRRAQSDWERTDGAGVRGQGICLCSLLRI